MTTISGAAHDAQADDAHTTVGHESAGQDAFSTDITGLPAGVPTETVHLSDGDVFDLRVAPVTKQIGEDTVRMLAYNGSIPGPTLLVRQGTEVVVNAANDGDLETTVHWHGLRLDNRFDGTHHTQDPIEPGGAFGYRIAFPDPGVYWYHPHIRQDYGQEMGLYGTIVVEPTDPDYWPPVNRELTLTLDDILLTDGTVAPFSRTQTTHTAMGRFGDVLLVNGDPDLKLTARAGEVVRLYLVNTANTRVFNVAIPGARMKLVGGDSGRYEHEQFVQSAILAPSERVVVDVQFTEPGTVTLEHHTPDRVYPLAEITVTAERVAPDLADEFGTLRINADMVAERDRITPMLERRPGQDGGLRRRDGHGRPGHRPRCRGDLRVPDAPRGDQHRTRPLPGLRHEAAPDGGANGRVRLPDAPRGDKHRTRPMPGLRHETGAREPRRVDHRARGPPESLSPRRRSRRPAVPRITITRADDQAGEGIEWEDDMVEVNRMTTPENMRWILLDRDTGERNHGIDWRFRVGDQVKIRLVNEMDSDHPMHHPFHVHGAGRFLILSRDGTVEPNLVWKDTVLVRRGETVDILLDVTNPGVWMAHCHIAEHHESGMMFNFHVDPAVDPATAPRSGSDERPPGTLDIPVPGAGPVGPATDRHPPAAHQADSRAWRNSEARCGWSGPTRPRTPGRLLPRTNDGRQRGSRIETCIDIPQALRRRPRTADLGSHLGSHPGRRATRLLVARRSDRLRHVHCPDRGGVHRVRGSRRSPDRHRRRNHRRKRIRGARRGRRHRVGVAARPRLRRPRIERPVATPQSLRRQHTVVAPVLHDHRLGRRRHHRRGDHQRASPSILNAIVRSSLHARPCTIRAGVAVFRGVLGCWLGRCHAERRECSEAPDHPPDCAVTSRSVGRRRRWQGCIRG